MYRHHNVLALLLYSLFCLPLLATLSTANPIVRPPSAFFQISQSPPLQNKWNPRSPGRTDLPLSGVELDLLEKRIPPVPLFNGQPGVLEMKLFRFIKFVPLIPVDIAAKYLAVFFEDIAVKAAGVWTIEPRTNYLVVNEGRLRFSLLASGDTIPWDVVLEVAVRLMVGAQRGFAELFEAVMMDDNGKIAITISLTVVDALSNSDGSSSSDGVTSNYREGSVPSVTFP